MFKVGDKVVYPKHGAGTIIGVEEREVLGKKQQYYIIDLSIGGLTAMLPINKAEKLGIRKVIDEDEVKEVINVLKGDKSKMSKNWNRRYRNNLEKIKTGDIYEVTEVVRNLTLRDMEKGLSTGEKKMLNNARQILISELVLAKEMDEEQVEAMINDIFYSDDKS
ncbi:CarD family transcriptional regulator [Anoxybacter fermentans]|uniref:CarD family transcriptional regulator n=1 Tax=Anoxybacter fermentans TaxID=1323375 RepID=A0A3Q9HSC9_9FIRM|nr:CarD family transcriptional regulator [Anoxybacter fermentans]AZR74689.1 CarD family transcriptional regulator [Anoxybacter fermentans]